MNDESFYKSNQCVCIFFVYRSRETDERGMWESARLGLRFQGWRVLPRRNPASESQPDAPGLDNDRATCPGKYTLTDAGVRLSETETVWTLLGKAPRL